MTVTLTATGYTETWQLIYIHNFEVDAAEMVYCAGLSGP
jgi:hypothetical protein